MKSSQAKRNNVVELHPSSNPDIDLYKEKLVAVGKNNDRQAFSELFAFFAPKIKSFALANPYGSNPSQFADDLVQEVMIKIWNKAGSYDPNCAAASTWIFTIARNCRIDMIRKLNRQNFPLESADFFDIEDEDGPHPFQSVQQRHYERDLRSSLDQLPHEQAQTIAKVYLEGKSHQEVADELDVPLGTVKSRVRLALNKLKVITAV